MKTLILNKIMSDSKILQKEGEYFDSHYYRYIITDDIDVYKQDGKLLFKFRKKYLDDELCQQAVEALRKHALKKHDNRGASSGILDNNKLPNYVGKLYKTFKFRSHYYRKSDGQKSKSDISNLAPSNIIGYFDRRDRNIPNSKNCRLTAFSKNEIENWNQTIPLIKNISDGFKKLCPTLYQNQLARANLSKNFCIPDTCFSTVTVNYSWRTACHLDKGDYPEGFGNLVVCEDPKNPNKFKGCYLGFPQYGICVDVRHTDFLAMDVHEWHCNTEFIGDRYIPCYKFKEKDIVNKWYYNRMSFVCYLKKKYD